MPRLVLFGLVLAVLAMPLIAWADGSAAKVNPVKTPDCCQQGNSCCPDCPCCPVCCTKSTEKQTAACCSADAKQKVKSAGSTSVAAKPPKK